MRRRRRRRYLPFLWALAVLGLGVGVNLHLALRPDALEARLRSALEETFACEFEYEGYRVSLSRGIEISGLRLFDEAAPGGTGVARVSRLQVLPRFGRMLVGDFLPRRISLEGVELRVVRGEGGGWNVERVLRAREGAGGQRFPELVVDGCRIEYSDGRASSAPLEHSLEDLRLRVRPSAVSEGGGYRFEAEVETPLARRVRLEGRLDTSSSPRLESTIEVFGADLRGGSASLLDELWKAGSGGLDAGDGSDIREGLDVRGDLDARVGLSFDTRSGLEIRFAELRLEGAEAEHPWLPQPFRGGALVSMREGRGSLELEGTLGEGALRGSATAELEPRSLSPLSWDADLRIERFAVEARDGAGFRGPLRKLYEDFRPRGELDVALEASGASGWNPSADGISALLRFRDLEITHARFPYPTRFEEIDIAYGDGVFRLPSRARARLGGGTLTVERLRVRPGGDGEVDARMEVEGLGLDARLRDALPPPARRVWDELQLEGKTDATVFLEREGPDGTETGDGSPGEPPDRAPEGTLAAGGVLVGERAGAPRKPVHVTVEARPQGASLRYRRFPYLLDSIRGTLTVNGRRKEMHLALEGFHGRSVVYGEGTVNLYRNGGLELRLRAEDLHIDDDLTAAFPRKSRDVVRLFNFEGRARTVATIRKPGDDVRVSVHADLIEGSVKHEKFAYPLELAQGHISVEGSGRIVLAGLRTPEGSRPRVAFSGIVDCDEEPARVTYDFDIAGLDVDEKLEKALPRRLRSFVEGSGLSGSFDGRLKGKYTIWAHAPERNVFTYAGTGLRSSNAAVDFGIAVSEMQATGGIAGTSGPGEEQSFEGDLHIQSARFNRLKLGDTRVHFVFGEVHPAVRGEEVSVMDGYKHRISEELERRLTAEKVAETFQLSAMSDDFYGGRAQGFLYVDTGRRRDFAGDVSAAAIAIGKASKDVFGVSGKDLSGTAVGSVRFSGRVGDWRTIQGAGEGRITDAELAAVPLFSSLFRLLQISDGPYFREVSLPYEIRDGRFRSGDIRMKSPILGLRGGGTLDFEGSLDLELQPYVLDVSIPILDQIFFLVKKVLADVHVGGTLADPAVELRTAGVPLPFVSGRGED